MSELLKSLRIAKTLAEDGDQGAEQLRAALEVSPAGFSRHLAEVRHLGAEIEAYRSAGGAWLYRLKNWDKIRKTAEKWIELEERRSLIEPAGIRSGEV